MEEIEIIPLDEVEVCDCEEGTDEHGDPCRLCGGEGWHRVRSDAERLELVAKLAS